MLCGVRWSLVRFGSHDEILAQQQATQHHCVNREQVSGIPIEDCRIEWAAVGDEASLAHSMPETLLE